VGVSRTYVKSVDVGIFPQVRRNFQVTRCNQCEDPPCVAACPTAAMYRRGDGIVDFDKSICIGCKACIAACPYDAIFINPEDLSAEKCNFCAHRLEVGLEPACVVVCPTEAIMVGNLSDPSSRVAQLVQRQPVQVRRPEKGTQPKLFYKGAHEATLDPLAARRPAGDTYAFSQIPRGAHLIEAGNPRTSTSSAAALLSYDVGHASPWGWRVSLYTWTKSVSAGGYLVILLFALGGLVNWQSPVLRLAGPSLGLAMLGATGLLLVWDLTHPLRFYLLFTHPQWRSWLVRGGFVIAGYGAVLVAQLGAGIAGAAGAERVIAIFGLPLSVMTAVYTAFLFAQAKGRDLWQSPLLAPMLLVQSLLAGSAALLLIAAVTAPSVVRPLSYALAGAALVELLLQTAEVLIEHPTEHARLAVSLMLRGRLGWAWWVGSTLVAVVVFAPALGWPAGALALLGLLGQEHAYVQAGQAVPLA
jgi:Fe-S-cluster-containing dehydrogenase component/formate-dependent nitrite reductase membrane component NrfD